MSLRDALKIRAREMEGKKPKQIHCGPCESSRQHSRPGNILLATTLGGLMESEMKEALMVITSAWSVTFIVLFLASVTTVPQDGLSPERVHIILFLLVGAVTGSGWLWFRHKLRKQHPPVRSAKTS
jgi:hypothetical protein